MTSKRRAMLAKVHIARKDLALSEDSYRDVVQRIAGVPSAAGCTDAQLDALLAEFRRLGWKVAHKRPLCRKPLVRKIYAIWADMAPLLSDHSAQALRSFVGRQTRDPWRPRGVGAPEFLEDEDAHRVIEGLKAWLARLQAKADAAARGAAP